MGKGRSMIRNGLLAALDVGSSKVCCFIARPKGHEQPNVIGIGQQISQGVKTGALVDMEQLARSQRKAHERGDSEVQRHQGNP